jgi:hypothetical protein
LNWKAVSNKDTSLQTSAFSLMTHTVTLLTEAFIAHCAFEWLGIIVNPKVILEVAHLFEHFFAIVDTANKELTSSHC